MTVAELIEALKQMPQDLKVVDIGKDVSGCRVVDEYYDGDSANPNCPIITVVELI